MDKLLDDLANMRAIGTLPDGRPLPNGHRNGIHPISTSQDAPGFLKNRQSSYNTSNPSSPIGQRGNMGAMSPRPLANSRPQVRTVGRTTKTITRKPSSTGEKVLYGGVIYAVQAMWSVPKYYKAWKEYFYPHEARPDIVKTYPVRSHLPVRLVPSSNLTTSATRREP